jgi:hypothetical protein
MVSTGLVNGSSFDDLHAHLESINNAILQAPAFTV